MESKPAGDQRQFCFRVFIAALRIACIQACCGNSGSRSCGRSPTKFLGLLSIASKPRSERFACPAITVQPTGKETAEAGHEAYLWAEPWR
jgi:hypothetical protein